MDGVRGPRADPTQRAIQPPAPWKRWRTSRTYPRTCMPRTCAWIKAADSCRPRAFRRVLARQLAGSVLAGLAGHANKEVSSWPRVFVRSVPAARRATLCLHAISARRFDRGWRRSGSRKNCESHPQSAQKCVTLYDAPSLTRSIAMSLTHSQKSRPSILCPEATSYSPAVTSLPRAVHARAPPGLYELHALEVRLPLAPREEAPAQLLAEGRARQALAKAQHGQLPPRVLLQHARQRDEHLRGAGLRGTVKIDSLSLKHIGPDPAAKRDQHLRGERRGTKQLATRSQSALTSV